MPGEPPATPPPPTRKLEGWKEIGNYLDRDQRTAQRWEKEGLPIFREGGKVFALPADLDRWRESRIIGPQKDPRADEPGPDPTPAPAEVRVFRRPGILVWGSLAFVLLGCLAGWWFWPREAQLLSIRQITRDGRHKINAIFPYEQQIFFTEYVNGREAAAVVPLTGGNVSHLRLPPAEIVDLSKSRKSLLVSNSDDKQLREVTLSTMESREIPVPAQGSTAGAVWDPAGRVLALPTKDLLTIFEPWKNSERVRFSAPGAVFIAGWNPSGSRLRFEVHDFKSGTAEFWEYSAKTGQARPLGKFSGAAIERGGAWSSDGRFFAFQAQDQESSQIWVAEAADGAGGKAYPVPSDGRFWRNPAFVPGSNTILAIGGQDQGQLVTLLGAGVAGPNVLQGISGYELDYSPDGRWVAYTRYPDHSIWRCRPDGSDPRQLSPAGMAAHQPHWAPSGDRLAFMGKAAGERARWRIYLARAEGGALEEALPEGDDQGVPSWSADGQSIIFGDRKTQVGFNGATIHQLNLATHTVSGIDSPVGLWSPRMSPDGRHLAAVTHDNKSLYVRDNGRKTWRRCLTMEALDDAVWSRDSSWIQFVGVGSAKTSTLFRVPVGCGEAKEVLDLSAYQFVGDTWFGIAPDGSPMGLVRLPDEIYAIEWRLALRLP